MLTKEQRAASTPTAFADLIERLEQPPVFAQPADSQRLQLIAKEAAQALRTLAAEKATLEAEFAQAREVIAEANNSLFGSQGYFLSLNGGKAEKYHLARPIEDLKAHARQALEKNSAGK